MSDKSRNPATGAIVAPIYQTSTYVQEALGKNKGYDYARTAHPNRRALERCVARLEGGEAAYVFTTGMAAIDALFRLLRPGDHTIISAGRVWRRVPADDATAGSFWAWSSASWTLRTWTPCARRCVRIPK